MDTLDDDELTIPDIVSEYYFFDSKDEPVSFTELPVHWGNTETSYDHKTRMYLRGTTDNGLQKVHKQVKAWRYAFLTAKPEISVLSRDNNWIRLQKPRKCYETEIRTILITLQCLHFCNREPKASRKDLRYHLCKVFSSYEILPSENDLIVHLDFIREAVKRDRTLRKSKFLASFLEGSTRKRRRFDENDEVIMKPSFIVDSIKLKYEHEDKESDDEKDIYDTVCALCDNGGDLTCCEGGCLRAFHATVKSAKSAESYCKSLCLPADEVNGSQPFICLNCSLKQHQCFACGELGSSNKASGAHVFCCSLETCGHFFHPRCVSKLLKDESDSDAHDCEEAIVAGEPFTCPAHKCHKCKQEENEKVKGLQFAICRRCPKSYHKKCLPRKIMFDCEDNDEDVIVRGWNNLLPKSRALIFCLKHKMDKKLHTAERNIKFPEMDHSKKEVAGNKEDVNSAYTFNESRVKKLSSGKRLRMSEPAKKRSKENLSTNTESNSKDHSTPVDENEQIPKAIPMEIETKSCELNGKISVKTAQKESAYMKSQKESSECDNGETGTKRKVDRHKERGISYQSRPSKIQHSDNHGYNRDGRRESFSGQRNVCSDRDSNFAGTYRLADPSMYNRSNTSEMKKYAPKLEELNNRRMKNRSMGNVSDFEPWRYRRFQHPNS